MSKLTRDVVLAAKIGDMSNSYRVVGVNKAETKANLVRLFTKNVREKGNSRSEN